MLALGLIVPTRPPLDLDAMTGVDPIEELRVERSMLEGAIESRRVDLQRLDTDILRQRTELERLEELRRQSKAEASDALVWQRLEEIAEAAAIHVADEGLSGFSNEGFKFWLLEMRRLVAATCSTLGVDVGERAELREAGKLAPLALTAAAPAGGTDGDQAVTIAKARELTLGTAAKFFSGAGDTWYADVRAGFRALVEVLGATPDEGLAESLAFRPEHDLDAAGLNPTAAPLDASEVDALEVGDSPALEGLEPDEAADVPTPAVDDEEEIHF